MADFYVAPNGNDNWSGNTSRLWPNRAWRPKAPTGKANDTNIQKEPAFRNIGSDTDSHAGGGNLHRDAFERLGR